MAFRVCRNTSARVTVLGAVAGAGNQVAERAGTEEFLTLKGNAAPVFPGRGWSDSAWLQVKLTRVQAGVRSSQRGTWSGSRRTHSLRFCCSLCSCSFPLFIFFFPFSKSASITQKVKISNSKSLTTLCNYNPRAWFCSLLQADRTVRAALPALVWKQRNKKTLSTCITLFSRGCISVYVKIPSLSRVAPVKRTPLFWEEWHDSHPQLTSSWRQFWWQRKGRLCALGVLCTEAIWLNAQTKKDKMLGSLLLPCHLHQ